MVTARGGWTKLGCLVTALLLVAALYVGFNLGEPYWRYYQYSDAMRQTARFGSQLSDPEIAVRLRYKADSLGLPPDAGRVSIIRTPRRITLSTQYFEVVELPFYRRVLTFRPRVEAPL